MNKPASRYSDRTFPSYLKDIPLTESWAIIREASVHHEGDERSRTNPGHGYPANTTHHVEVAEVFTDEEIFKYELARQVEDNRTSYGSRSIRGFKLTPYVTETVTTTSVSPAIKNSATGSGV